MGAVPQFENDALGASQPYEIFLQFTVTAAKAASVLATPRAPNIAFGFDAAAAVTDALGQTTVNRTLGTDLDIVTATAFGSTALGTDAFGFALGCNGQIKAVRSMSVTSNLGAGGANVSAFTPGQTTALPNTLPALARVALTAAGNIGGQFVLAGLDAATSGTISIRILVDLK